jgi:phage-related tail fiber protein
MSLTQIRNTQVMPTSITNNEIATVAAIATSKLQDGSLFVKSDGSVAFTAVQSGITPTLASHLTTKGYVDGLSTAITGDATGSGTTSIAVTLAASGVTAGTYSKVTVDAKGRVTVGASIASGDVTTALGFTPVNAITVGAANGIATLDATGKLTIAQIPASLVGSIQYQSTWNASTNTPSLASGVGTKGQYYKVSVAGTTSIDGNANWTVGDLVIFDGTVWEQVQGGSSDVVSVFGRVGAVTMLSSDVTTALGFTPYNATNPSGYISANQSITVSGDATGSGTTAITLTLANSGVTTGTYTKVTVDAKGRVTTGTALTATDVNTALGFTVANTTHITRETPSGSVNGVNMTFTLANTPIAGSEMVFVNGVMQDPGAGNDYTISTSTITMLYALQTNDKIRVTYIR